MGQVRGTRVRGGSPERGHPVFIGSALCRIPLSYGESFWVGGAPEIQRSLHLVEDKVNRQSFISNETWSVNRAGNPAGIANN